MGRLLGPKMVFSLFLKSAAMHYWHWELTKVLQPFDCLPNVLLIEQCRQ